MTTRRYANGTTVSIERTKAELDKLLQDHGATQIGIMTDRTQGFSVLVFSLTGRMVRLEVYDGEVEEHRRTPAGRERDDKAMDKAWRAERRRRWRALLLIVKAKLEVIAAGDSTVDGEFLAHVVLPDGQTVGNMLGPRLDEAYRTGAMPEFPMLPAAKKERG